ncbi:HD domain-containing protein [Bombilactobacillus thymidiniphilus]|uniref:HD domain-containing protein n=1 Tax=Bombilactobacillus thymidiniphilus TaxID=2923363 RepID=A0ABY4PCI4_9LACO|nr:HD domain-containing protein [Bombilactobacillus thymidiniphilus]UQS83378.1 HD domain-containing protein [Bombilactobacillus thymidiniphilus]
MNSLNWQNDPEYLQQVADLLILPEIQQLQLITQHRYSNRLEHSLSVSYHSFLIGKKLHLNVRALARGGLLHDLFYYDWDNQALDFRTHAYVHSQIALENAQSLTDLTPMEADIISKHMFGATLAPPKYLESLLVNLVDDYCAVKEAFTPIWAAVKQKLQTVISY